VSDNLIRLHWTHPNIGEIDEVVCPAHNAEVTSALRVLGMGSIGSDGSAPSYGVEGPGELPVCLRCQVHPANLPRQFLRQWFGGTR
jgi:hypothetical protein